MPSMVSSLKKPRKRKCKVCKEWFEPWTTLQKTCNVECAIKLAKVDRKKDEKKKLAERKKKAKPRSWWLSRARIAFQEYVRARDRAAFESIGEPPVCICCLRNTGGQFHAGHYMTVGSRPEHQFHPANCHLQLAQCNYFASQSDSNYRDNLIAKVGVEMVEYLENVRARSDWTVDELEEIRKHYKNETKAFTV